METLKFKTNIKCSGCEAKVKPYLDAIRDVKNWSVDLMDPSRTLTVEGEVKSEQIINALKQAGYEGARV